MKISKHAWIALALVLGTAAPAAAQVPDEVSFTARLVNDGVPYEGVVALNLQLYRAPTGGAGIWSETTAATAAAGLVAVQLGATNPMDETVIDGQDLYLEVTVDGTVLSPRLAIGSVPYAQKAARADFAEECGSVPTGAVMSFDLDACPTGWSPLDAARGRAIVGMPAGGTLGGVVGPTPLTDLENRAHTHVVDPAAATTSAAGGHSHTVDPASVTSTFVDLNHTHTVNPATFTITGGAHNHAWGFWNQSTLAWSSWQADGATVNAMVDYTNGFTNSGSGSYPVEDNGGASTFEYTESSTHSHDIDVPSTTSSAASVNLNHAHNVDVPATTTSAAADHSHTVDLPATTSTAATTGAVMPYLQLLVCRKN